MRYLPLILIGQCLLMLAPYVLWRVVTRLSEYSTARLVHGCHVLQLQTISNAQGTEMDSSEGSTERPTSNYERPKTGYGTLAAAFLYALERRITIVDKHLPRLQGYILVLFYVITKIGYLVTGIIQMAILGDFFGVDFLKITSGHTLLDKVYQANHGNGSQIFPRTVFCDMQVSVFFQPTT